MMIQASLSIILLARLSLVLAITCPGAHNANFENVRHRIPTSNSPSKGDGANGGAQVVFDVVHRHHQKIQTHRQSSQNVRDIFNTEDNTYSPIEDSLKRGILRQESLNRAIREERIAWRSTVTRIDERKQRKLMMESEAVVAAGGEYMVQMQIGTPPKPVLLILDTGSGLTWIQCKQCLLCSPEQEPLFDPSTSSSYVSLSCQSPSCLNSSSLFQCNHLNNSCEYGVQYGQSSFSTGVVSTDTLQLLNGSMVISDFLFGCGIFVSTGDFVGNSGLLGLSRSNISFTSQLGMQHPEFGRKFTLCFANLAQNFSSTGFISFGNSSDFPSGMNPHKLDSDRQERDRRKIVYTPFATTPFPTQFYYLGLTGISVDGALLPINSSVFELDDYGNGGTVIDSGTTLTLLNPQAFAILRDAFRSAGAARRKLPAVSAEGFNSTGHVIDTCYRFGDGFNETSNSSLSSAVPSISLHFAGGMELPLPAESVLFPFEKGLYCLAFASTLTDLGINVIGNIQQQNLRIEYDLENSKIGFESVPNCDH